jgi:hypothetical protein
MVSSTGAEAVVTVELGVAVEAVGVPVVAVMLGDMIGFS